MAVQIVQQFTPGQLAIEGTNSPLLAEALTSFNLAGSKQNTFNVTVVMSAKSSIRRNFRQLLLSRIGINLFLIIENDIYSDNFLV